ncbi:hypothetical protein BC793_13625 [Actinoplanes xinjiangensis]|uniref:Uncharacterized protein n=1 Tax=Actinoplanes xinjiangensis TaxID=512350 RepID=A0A316F381_9ACTN|nr:hypothetical protein BC793_13625 [Actinoplanes xinjiangensis]GIF44249.1 hypothetical protein Axi01nite_85600 [Actinoplanes xinjiangensis]
MIESDHRLAERVQIAAKNLGIDRPHYGPPKPLKPISAMHQVLVDVTPIELLHEVGRATVFQERAALRDIQRIWAQLRYCDAFSYGKVKLPRGRHLLRMSEDALAKRFHHANVQSETLGIGFAIILARHVLSHGDPSWTWIPVDAEMVLDAGFDIPEGRLRPYSRKDTKLRPDYFLFGHKSDGLLSRTRLVVLECKGTHYQKNVLEQLSKAAFQLQSVHVGGATPPGLMISTVLEAERITVHILDPDGDDELWQGDPAELSDETDQLNLSRTPSPENPVDNEALPEQLDLFPGLGPALQVFPEPAGTASLAEVYPIPAEQKGWFARVLSRTAAAASLLFAGDQTRAQRLISERQRQRTFGNREPDLPELHHRNTGIGIARGTSTTVRWTGGRRLEVFNGIDVALLTSLNEHGAGEYVSRTRAGKPEIDGTGDEVFLRAGDGTVTGFRLLPSSRRRRRI